MEKPIGWSESVQSSANCMMNLLKQEIRIAFFAAEQKRNDYRYTFYLGAIREWWNSWHYIGW